MMRVQLWLSVATEKSPAFRVTQIILLAKDRCAESAPLHGIEVRICRVLSEAAE
jgi:hypothetical protein